MTTDTEIAAVAKRLIEARTIRAATREELRAFREEHGRCEYDLSEIQNRPCYRDELNRAAWCPICISSQEIYDRCGKWSDNVGAATRVLTRLCRESTPWPISNISVIAHRGLVWVIR